MERAAVGQLSTGEAQPSLAHTPRLLPFSLLRNIRRHGVSVGMFYLTFSNIGSSNFFLNSSFQEDLKLLTILTQLKRTAKGQIVWKKRHSGY